MIAFPSSKGAVPLGYRRCKRCGRVHPLSSFPVLKRREVEVIHSKCSTCFKIVRKSKGH